MNTTDSMIDELIQYDVEGPKVSLYLPAAGEHPDQIFLALRNQAFRLLEKSGDENIIEEFKRWSAEILIKLPQKRNIALFLGKDFRRIIPLTTDVPPRVIVSDSFHVKPLLYSRSTQARGILLEFHRSGLTIWGSEAEELEVIDYVQAPIPDTNWPQSVTRKTLTDFLHNIAANLPRDAYVQVTGAPHGLPRSRRFWEDYVSDVFIDAYPFGNPDREHARAKFLSRLKLWRLARVNADVIEKLRAPNATVDPQEILRGIREKRLQSITISLEAVRWGTVDPASGTVTYHRMQLDHRDDDILDDLAELAVKNGVDVKVVKQSHLPSKVEIIAC